MTASTHARRFSSVSVRSHRFLSVSVRVCPCSALLCCLAFLLANTIVAADAAITPAGPSGKIASIKAKPINESSGIVPSAKHPGVFWTHNDSGDSPRIFAIRLDGSLVGVYQISGAKARDWEDICSDGKGHLYIADIGNNGRKRKDLVIYKVAEPDKLEKEGVLKVIETIPVSYALGKAYDCEALCFSPQGNLMVITKMPKPATVYEYSDGKWLPGQVLNIPDFVTGASVNKKGELVISTYVGYHIFKQDENGKWQEQQRVLGIVEQCEAACWDGEKIVLTSEQRSIFQFDPKAFGKKGKAFKQPIWPINDPKYVYHPVDDSRIKSKTLSFTIRNEDDKTAIIELQTLPSKPDGTAAFLFSTERPDDQVRYSTNDTILQLARKNGTVKAILGYAVRKRGQAVLPKPEVETKDNVYIIRIPKNFLDQQKAFAAYFTGWHDRPRGWPFSYYRVHGRPYLWSEKP